MTILTAQCILLAILFGGAIALMWVGKDGWGWLLFFALLVGSTGRCKCGDDDNDDDSESSKRPTPE